MNKRSILFVMNCLDIGGAEIQVTRLAQGMLRRGWSVTVVSLRATGPLQAVFHQMGAVVYCLNMRKGVPHPAGIVRLRRVVRRVRPQVIHSHIVHANLLVRVTRLVAPMPIVVCTAHNIKEGNRCLELGYRLTDSLADLTTNVSQAAVDRYLRIRAARPGRIRFMPNGVDLAQFKPNSERRVATRLELGLGDAFVWMAVGRLEQQKGYVRLLRAFAEATRQTPEAQLSAARNVKLLIVGKGYQEPELKALAASLNLNERVSFLGMRRDIAALMNAADALVLSSAWEGMPMVLLESSASSLPIVATDVGGNAEVVVDGKSGLLVSSSQPYALVSAMFQMMSFSIARRLEMGRAGREHMARHFEMESVIDRWEAIYRELGERRVNRKATHGKTLHRPNAILRRPGWRQERCYDRT